MSTYSLPSLFQGDNHTAPITFGTLYSCRWQAERPVNCGWERLAGWNALNAATPFVFGGKVQDALHLANDAEREAGQEQMELYEAYVESRGPRTGGRPSKIGDMDRRAYLAEVAALPSVIARRAARWFLQALLRALEMAKRLFEEVKELSACPGDEMDIDETCDVPPRPLLDECADSERPLLTMEVIDKRAFQGRRVPFIDRDSASELREADQDSVDGQSHWLIRVIPLREFDVLFGHLYEDESDSEEASESGSSRRASVIEQTLTAIEPAITLCQGLLSRLQDVEASVRLFETADR